MKKRSILLAALLLVLLLSACSAGQAQPSASAAQDAAPQAVKITAEEAKARMDSGDPVVILDVRTQEEYDQKHIKDAILVPNETIDATQPAALPDLDAEILVYCRSGNRSAQAAGKLAAMGYTNVKDFGGINDWPYDDTLVLGD